MSRGSMMLGLFALLGAIGAAATFFVSGPERFFTNWLVWFLFLLTIGLGLAHFLLTPKLYRAQTMVQIEQRSPLSMEDKNPWLEAWWGVKSYPTQ